MNPLNMIKGMMGNMNLIIADGLMSKLKVITEEQILC